MARRPNDLPSDGATTEVARPGRPVGRLRVREGVLRALTDLIVSGAQDAGSTLPSEAELCLRFGVSRTALREAMQYLAAQGLIVSRTRAGTIVLERSRWNYLDPIILDSAFRHGPDVAFYRALLEARFFLEPQAASLAAERATAQHLAAMERALTEMAQAKSRNVDAWSNADLEFHTALFRATDNWVVMHFVTVIRAALLASFRLTNNRSPSLDHALGLHVAVFEAIRLRQPQEARAAMHTLLGLTRAELAELVPGMG